MKRNCNNCKALEESFGYDRHHCRLGHEIEIIKRFGDIPIVYRPLEECEKPTSMKALCNCEIEKYKCIKK